MRQQVHRVRGRMLVVAGIVLLAAPFMGNVRARQAPAGQTAPTPAAAPRLLNAPDHPSLRGFRWREIGPTGQGGRIDDLAVDERNPYQYFVGFATSGVWRTLNNGTTYDSIFESYGVGSIGDLTLAPSDPNILYVGTGEANNRQSSSIGNGMWKTTNALAANAADVKFEHVGLRDTQAIARVIVHPKDPNTVWVASMGHLYGPNQERGVFMTTDGGKNWTKTLFVTDNTGATELVIDPTNPNNLWAAMYERQRTAWGFAGGGPGSGLYQSTNGGKSWTKVTGNGLPRGTLGRIALDVCKSQPTVMYAQIEAAPDKETGADLDQPAAAGRGGQAGAPPAAAPPAGGAAAGAQAGGAQAGAGRGGGQPAPADPQGNGIWRSADKGKTWQFQSNENQRPMYFSQIRCDPNNPNTVYVGGVNPQKSIDGAKTFRAIQGQGHVDNHAIWINPLSGTPGSDSKHVMYGNDGGIDVSYDAGVRWESIRMWGVAYSYHVSADMRRPYWICTGLQDNGSWCGPSSTRTGGIHMWNWISVGGGDGFQTQVDPTDPNIFYTESQNGNINRYNLNTGQVQSVRPALAGGGGRGGGAGGGGGGAGGGGQAAAAGGGQAAAAGGAPAGGAPAQAGGGQAGGRGRGNVLNAPEAGAIQQFNWNSPIRLSPHNPSTLLFGGRQLFLSRDRGETWVVSNSLGKNVDLNGRSILEQPYSLPSCGAGRGGGPNPNRGKPCILSKHDGYVQNEFGSITELAESPVVPGVLWAGTDDGNVQVSRDGGLTFTEVGKNVPGVNHEYYVSGLEASWFDAGTAYLALDGHRHDDTKPYVFKTTDYGQTWKPIASNLPALGWVNSIRQDPVNRNLLYAPTEFGFFISMDDGANWVPFMPNLPHVRVDEALVHPRDRDLIIATHARGIWIMDDISALQNLTAEEAAKDAVLFKPRDAVQWRADRRNATEVPGDKWWAGEVAPPGTAIAYYLKAADAPVRVTITSTLTGQAVRACNGTSLAGLNRWQWVYTTDQALQQQLQAQQGGGGGGGRGGAQAGPPPDINDCRTTSVGGGGRGGGGGGGRGGGGGGGIGPGVYRVTLSVSGKEIGAQTFSILEDVWLNEK